MKVFIAGMAGFLGTHVAELFRERGDEVVGLDNLTKFELNRTGYNVKNAREYNVNFLKSIGAELMVGDIRDFGQIHEASEDCDYIINCAAQPAMTIALEDPRYDANVNIMGVLNLLELAKYREVPIILCSTIHTYGNGLNDYLKAEADRFVLLDYPNAEDWNGLQEIDECDVNPLMTGEITPLHVSKYANELYAQAYRQSYNMSVGVFRLTGMYGPRQFGGEDHGWVANFAIRTILGLPVKVFGTDKQVRDVLYVKDAAKAFADWYDAGAPSGLYNIGGGPSCMLTIRECLEQLTRITGKHVGVKLEVARKGDLWYFCCDTTRARRVFQWQSQVLPAEGLNELVKWINTKKELFSV